MGLDPTTCGIVWLLVIIIIIIIVNVPFFINLQYILELRSGALLYIFQSTQ